MDPTKSLLIMIGVLLLLSGCDGSGVTKAANDATAAVSSAVDSTGQYISDHWNSGLSLEAALASSEADADGRRSIELCELSASGLTDFVGGAATMGSIVPMIAGSSVVIIATSTAGFISIAPAIDPTLTTVATTVAVAYGAMKLYCARDKIMGHQSMQDFVALVNEYSDKGSEALKVAYTSQLKST